jgi:sec-independent protein translocase protein TatC
MELPVVGKIVEAEEPTVVEHLKEIRSRLLKCVIVVAITTVVSFLYVSQIIEVFTSRVENIPFVYTEVTEMFGTSMKVALYTGLALALPFLIFQLVRFIAPGLKTHEKKYLYILLPFITLLFVVGAAFAYYVLLPPALNILLDPPFLDTGIAEPFIKIGNYIGLVVKLMFWIGVMFEAPLVMAFLARIGVVTASKFAKYGKIAIVVAFILAAIITPTFDPINQAMVAGSMIVLYEFGVLLAWIVQPKRKESIDTETMAYEGNQI